VEPDALELRSTRGRIALAATVAASSMGQLDATVVNVALPHIGRDFDASVSSLQWVLTGYLLTLASLILLGGALGDRFGRRRVFVVGTVWFAAASAMCAVAPGVGVLVAARMLQGAGAALLTPGSLAIIQVSFRPDDRARAVGIWAGFSGVAGAVGPFLGGWLVGGPGWRWAFLINVPIAGLVVVAAHAIPETREADTSEHIDLVGASLAIATLSAATWALTQGRPRGWTDATVEVAVAVSVAGTYAFVRHTRRTPGSLVPPRLFASRGFTVTNLATTALYASIGITFFLVSYQLQVGAGWTALAAGTALLPATVLTFVGSGASGALAQRIGPRLQLTAGPLLLAAGLLLLTRIGTNAHWLADVLPGAFLFGAGLVTFVAPLTATVMGSVDADHVSIASGVNNAVARTANLAAVAVIPSVSRLVSATGPAAVTHAYRVGLVIAACCATIAAPISFLGLRRSAQVAPRLDVPAR
jgi:EmrB/QacA subfamily drug resistance transporter